MKRFILTVVLLFFVSFPVSAETVYTEQYDASGAEEIYGFLSEDAKRIIDRMEIDISDTDWVNKIEPKNIFREVIDFFSSGMREPFAAAVAIFGLIILVSVANTFEGFKPYSNISSTVFAICFSIGLLTPVFSLIESCSSAVKGISVLMGGFIPIYAGILMVSGSAATASGMSFLLLAASSAISAVSSFVIVPLMSCYLGIGVVGSAAELGGTARLGEAIKKTATWILSFALTLFLGFLTIQTTVNAAADNLGIKAARFMLGSFIPVAGGALSESLTTLLGSLKLLKSSVGMFGVFAVAATVLPVVIELLCWRVTLFLLDAISELFGANIKTDVIKAADSVLAVLIGVLLFSGALFIISLAIVAGR